MIGINLVATGSNKFQIITKLYTRLLTLIMLKIFTLLQIFILLTCSISVIGQNMHPIFAISRISVWHISLRKHYHTARGGLDLLRWKVYKSKCPQLKTQLLLLPKSKLGLSSITTSNSHLTSPLFIKKGCYACQWLDMDVCIEPMWNPYCPR